MIPVTTPELEHPPVVLNQSYTRVSYRKILLTTEYLDTYLHPYLYEQSESMDAAAKERAELNDANDAELKKQQDFAKVNRYA